MSKNFLKKKKMIPFAIWVESNTIDGTKMAFDTSKFFFEYHVVETCIKFSHSGWSGGDFHGFLATSKYNLKQCRKENKSIVCDGSINFHWNYTKYTRKHKNKIYNKKANTYMFFERRKWSRINGTFCPKSFHVLQRTRIKQLKKKS